MRATRAYYLLLVDLQESSTLPPRTRDRVMRKLQGCVGGLNSTLVPKPVLGLTISYGDEIAGLFDTPSCFYLIVDTLRDCLYPMARLRFVATHGKIGVVSKDIRQVGGEVFKKANEYMTQIKRQRQFCLWNFPHALQSQTLTALALISNDVLERMTPYQREVCRWLEKGFTQKQISQRTGRHPQSVSDAAKRGGVMSLLRAHEAIRDLLQTVEKKEVTA